MAAELLLISGNGGNAKAFGDPAVHGPNIPDIKPAVIL